MIYMLKEPNCFINRETYYIEMIEKYINITIHKDLGDENYDNSQKIKKR